MHCVRRAYSFTIMRYDENGLTAATALEREIENGRPGAAYRVVAMGFPFEVIKGEDNRSKLMREVLKFLGL